MTVMQYSSDQLLHNNPEFTKIPGISSSALQFLNFLFFQFQSSENGVHELGSFHLHLLSQMTSFFKEIFFLQKFP